MCDRFPPILIYRRVVKHKKPGTLGRRVLAGQNCIEHQALNTSWLGEHHDDPSLPLHQAHARRGGSRGGPPFTPSRSHPMPPPCLSSACLIGQQSRFSAQQARNSNSDGSPPLSRGTPVEEPLGQGRGRGLGSSGLCAGLSGKALGHGIGINLPLTTWCYANRWPSLGGFKVRGQGRRENNVDLSSSSWTGLDDRGRAQGRGRGFFVLGSYCLPLSLHGAMSAPFSSGGCEKPCRGQGFNIGHTVEHEVSP